MRYDLPTIRTLADCDREFSDIIVISKYDTYEKFDSLYEHLYLCCCACFEIKECLSYPVKFIFYPEDKKVFQLSIPKLLLNLNSWRPLIELQLS